MYISIEEQENLIDLYQRATGQEANPETLIRGTPINKFSKFDGGYKRIIDWCHKKIDEKMMGELGIKTPTRPIFDREKMIKATEMFLDAVGHPDWRNDPNTKESPVRVAKTWEVMLGGYGIDPKQYLKTFPTKTSDMVLVKNVPIISYCSHHICPFYGTMAIAYIPNGKLIGLSKLVRFARVHLKRLQLQEDLTAQIADTLNEVLQPLGVMVYISATHTCMSNRGIRSQGAVTITSATRGLFKEDPKSRAEFMEALKQDNNVYGY